MNEITNFRQHVISLCLKCIRDSKDLHIVLVNRLLKTKKKYKNKEKIQKPKETRNSRYIYQNKLGKACFQYDIAYRDFNVLSRRTAFEIAKNPKYHEYQHEHASMV